MFYSKQFELGPVAKAFVNLPLTSLGEGISDEWLDQLSQVMPEPEFEEAREFMESALPGSPVATRQFTGTGRGVNFSADLAKR